MGRKIDRKCPVCARVYVADEARLKHGRQTSCSRECSYRMRAGAQRKAVEMECPVCGDSFVRIPRATRHGHSYCSRECHYRGRGLGLTGRVVDEPYRYTSGGMTALRRKGARRYASGAVGFPESELRLVERLGAARVDFIHQHVIDVPGGAYSVDFYFPRMGLIVELDGEGHGRPAARESDAERDATLAAIGLRVERVSDKTDGENAAAVGAIIGVRL